MKKIILACLFLVGCGDLDREEIECAIKGDCNKPSPTISVPVATPTPSRPGAPTPTPSAKPTVGLANPLCSGIADSRAHLLWKPVSDTSGNAVVVFDGKYKGEFFKVQAELKDGKFEDLFWKPLKLWGNPDRDGPRQHWRSKNKCRAFKDGALIVADDGFQVCKFKIPGDSCKRWE